MKVKISDVAREANVSKATVSLALNGSKKVSKQTREKVIALAKQMGYTPNPYARKLVTKKSSMIGLIVPDIENVYYGSLVRHLTVALSDSEYGLFFSTSDNSRLLERKVVEEMINNRMDALLLAPVNKPNDDLNYLNMLDEAGIPTLFLTSLYPGIERPCVMYDLYDGMKRMVLTLHEKGYRKITLINGPEGVYCLDVRTDGYLSAVKECGLSHVKVLRMEQDAYQNAYELIRDNGEMDADVFVCINDITALGVINALIEKGVRVPEDIAVTGFDDAVFSRISPVPITTARQDVSLIATEGAEMILSMIRGGEVSGAQQKLLRSEIVLKQSTR